MASSPGRIDTSTVDLDPSLTALAERLARHVHDLWVDRRARDGWTYGPNRNDVRREHPGLVPFDDLTESEKDVDRTVATGLLKALLALGYRVTPPS